MFVQVYILTALLCHYCTAQVTKLTLLHVNDHHSHLTEGSAGYINIYDDDIPTEVSSNNGDTTYIRAYYGGFPRLVTAFKDLEAKAIDNGRDVLKLHAGDAITGTTYFTLFEGDADAKLMSHICFDAFAPGNHEFDKGDAGLAKFLTAMQTEADASPSCPEMPAILGANIVPHDASPLLEEGVPSIDKSVIYTVSNGEKIGVIGIDVKRKTMESSQPDEGTILLDEKEVTAEQVALLTEQGVNKIILLTHIGYDNDQDWIATIEGVDVVVGGDSHSLLGDEQTSVFGSTRGPYATVVEKADGTNTCVVQAWDYSKVIGNLDIDFDSDGNVISCSGSPIFPLNPNRVTVRDAKPRYDMSPEDALSVMDSLVTRSEGQAMPIVEDPDTAQVLNVYSSEVEELSKTVVTQVIDFIGLEAGGYESGACDLVAQGFLLNPLSTADVAIQNRGGCRSSLKEVRKYPSIFCFHNRKVIILTIMPLIFEQGNFTVEDAYTLLPFSNTMVNIIMTGQQIKTVLEDAIDFYLDPTGSWGAYPRASGLRFDVNEAMEKGSRVSNLQVNAKLASSWTDIELDATYTVVTNNFIATPRDGYYEFGNIAEELKVDTFVEYAQSFIEYAETLDALEPVPEDRASTQNWSDVLPTMSPTPDSSSSRAACGKFIVVTLVVLCSFL